MIEGLSQSGRKKSARFAGICYAVLALAFFPDMLRKRLFVHGDAALTAANVLGSESLFRLSILGDVVCQIAFLLLGLTLYDLFKDVRKPVARAMLALVLAALPVAMNNMVYELAALRLFGSGEYARAMLLVEAFEDGVAVATVFWGLWLLPFGMLALRSGFMPKVLGVMLMVGCFGYLTSPLARIAAPGLRFLAGPGIAVAASAELAAVLWLLVFGARRRGEAAAAA